MENLSRTGTQGCKLGLATVATVGNCSLQTCEQCFSTVGTKLLCQLARTGNMDFEKGKRVNESNGTRILGNSELNAVPMEAYRRGRVVYSGTSE